MCLFLCVCLLWSSSSLFSVLNSTPLLSRQLIQVYLISVQFSSVAQLCPTPCDPTDRSTPGFPVPMPAARSKSCPLSWWRHTTISSFVVPLYIPLIHSPYGYLLICVLSKKIYCVTEFCFLFFLSNIVLLSPPACGTLLLTWGRCRAPHELLFHFLRHLSCSLQC